MIKPNILLALADDASHFGCYGHDFVRTPVIDAIAEEGMLFENAFTPNPKCAPSRAAILTGRYPWQNEAACNHNVFFPAGLTLFPDILENGGYHIGFTGKGWAPGDYKQNGYHRNPAGNEYNNYTLEPPEGSKISNCDYTANFKVFLDKKPADAPFYFWYGCREPHRPYTFGEGSNKSISEIDYLPSYWPDTPEVRQDMLDYAFEIEWFDHHLGNILNILRERGELNNTLIVVTSDNGCPFPRVKGQMYEQDFHLPMVVQWPEVFKRKRRIKDFINFIDIAPTFIEAAGLQIPECIEGKSFLGQLSCENDGFFDAARKVTFFGREKHDVGREGDLGYPVRCIRDENYLYIRNYAPERWPAGNPETGYTNVDSSPTKTTILDMYRCGNDTYWIPCFGKRFAEELFDIESDPECMQNLSQIPKYEEVKASMREKLNKLLLETRDPRITIDPDYFEKFPYNGSPHHSWQALLEGKFKPQKY